MKQFSDKIKSRINSIEIGTLTTEDSFRDLVLELLKDDFKVLDCGKSLRNRFDIAKNKVSELSTLDINIFKNYPDYLVDICNEHEVKSIEKSFDVVINFSLLEHTYDPFAACKNLMALTRPGGKVVGSAPFLFPRHAPSDLSYQDFFRFTRDSYAILFPNAKKITLFPIRGRLATSLNILTLRYRFNFEKNFPKLSKSVSNFLSSGDHSLQSSGYCFIIEK